MPYCRSECGCNLRMDNPFSKILSEGLSFLKKGGGGNAESVVGIDIGTSSIKVVQLKKKGGRAVLETYGTLALGPYAGLDVGTVTNLPVDKIAQALKDVIREAGVTTRAASLSIPATSSLVFLIELPPSIPEKDLPTIIPTEARKYIPVPISEITLDFWVIPKKEESIYEESEPGAAAQAVKTEVLIAAIHNDAVQKYKDISSQGDIDASFYEIEIFSGIRSTFAHELETVLLLDFGASRTKLSVVESGIVRSFHIINRGSFDITSALSKSLSVPFAEAEEIKRAGLDAPGIDKNVNDIIRFSVDYIIAEASSVILQYEKKHNKTIRRVVLTGGGAMLKGFYEAAVGKFSAEVVRGNPFSKVDAPAFLVPVLADTGPEFAVAAGLALRQLS